MIAIDTSALMAIARDEVMAGPCSDALATSGELLISAATVAEALIVARGRGLTDEMTLLLESLELTIVPVTAARALSVARAHARWGKGIHPAGLNYGDCFAYAVAQEHDCPLLFIGRDFARTDIRPALTAAPP